MRTVESEAVRACAEDVFRNLDRASRRVDELDVDDAELFLEDATCDYRKVIAALAEMPADGDPQEEQFCIELMTKLDASMALVEAMVSSLKLKRIDPLAFRRAYEYANKANTITGEYYFWARWELCMGALQCYFGDYSKGTVRALARAEAWLRDDHESPGRRHEWRQACCRLAVAYSKMGDDEKALDILLMAVQRINEFDDNITQYDVTILVMATVLLWLSGKRYEAGQMLGRAKLVIDLATNTGLSQRTSGKNVLRLERYMSPLGFFTRLRKKPRDVVEWPWI